MTPETAQRNARGRQGSRPALAAATAVCALQLLLALPAIFVPHLPGEAGTFQHNDMTRFHLPQINELMRHPLALLDYQATAATTPGLHVFMAWVARLLGYEAVSESTYVLRLLNALVGVAFVCASWGCFWLLSKSPWLASALVTPLLGSHYVLGATIWISTDNGAMLFYTLGLALLIFQRQRVILAAACATLMVFWRQIYLPVTGAYALPALLPGGWRQHAKLALAATVVPLVVVGIYAFHWGGLTPESTRSYNQLTLALAVPLHALAYTGLLAMAYVFLLLPALGKLGRRSLYIAAAMGAAVALSLWLGTETNYDRDRRFGSLVWLLARLTPVLHQKSLVVLVLGALGGFVLATMGIAAVRQRYYPAELVMLLLYFVGYSTQIFPWPRYIEPAILLTLGVHCARQGSAVGRWGTAGPILLGVVFAGMVQLRLWGLVGTLLR